MNETLNSIRNRPRFKLYTDLSLEEYEANLRDYLEKHRDQFYGNINKEVAIIFVRKEDDNYWKPNLALRIEKEDETNDVVQRLERYGPRVSRNWQNEICSFLKEDLRKRFEHNWSLIKESKNTIKSMMKMNEKTYDVNLIYSFTTQKGISKTVDSYVRFVFDDDGNIIKCYKKP